ncbi:MAG: DUF423 domain-containing protein [Bacteroidetes bacterium]|nr:DUF423 domain-containing protein [Bacteroidota bacterium]
MMKIFFISASLSMALSVIFGAFGAHALKEKLSPEMLLVFETAVRYQVYHSIGLFIVTFFIHLFPNANFNLVAWFFIFGILIFSGSLYILSITNIRWFGAITPVGGLFFIFGWLLLAWKTYKFIL